MSGETCPDCGRSQLLNLKRYRNLQSTGEHKAWCGRELNAVECELECDRFAIARLRSEVARLEGERREAWAEGYAQAEEDLDCEVDRTMRTENPYPAASPAKGEG